MEPGLPFLVSCGMLLSTPEIGSGSQQTLCYTSYMQLFLFLTSNDYDKRSDNNKYCPKHEEIHNIRAQILYNHWAVQLQQKYFHTERAFRQKYYLENYYQTSSWL